MPDMETTEKKRITLRSLWRLCPARHAVLLISLAWLAAYFLLRENRAVMNFLCKALVRPWHAFAGRLFSAVPFSVTEWGILFLAALGVVLLVLLIVRLIRAAVGEGLPHGDDDPFRLSGDVCALLSLVGRAVLFRQLHRTGGAGTARYLRAGAGDRYPIFR